MSRGISFFLLTRFTIHNILHTLPLLFSPTNFTPSPRLTVPFFISSFAMELCLVMKSLTGSSITPNPVTIDRRVPLEIWDCIFQNLYPSQLSRVSRVNKNLNMIVSSLVLWSRIFVISQGPKAHLRPLLRIPKSKSYMLFVCATSLHICERCFGLANFDCRFLEDLPLPVRVLLPRRSTEDIQYKGERIDLSWTVRLCLSCRREHFLRVEEPMPRHISNSWLSPTNLFKRYPLLKRVPGWHESAAMVKEIKAVLDLREFFGGDVGIGAVGLSATKYHDCTEKRIEWYQQQY